MKRQLFAVMMILAVAAAAVFDWSNAQAGETFVLRGKVLDLAGQGVEGAEVFIYDSANTRRPAEFITPKTDRDGQYTIELPVGRYWAVARVRQGEKFGPLLLGTRHSGEPVVIEPPAERVAEQDFSVADIREVARNKHRTRDDYVKISGRVLDGSGAPVANAYVLAHRGKEIERLPDYISGWTDEAGRYTLYLPPGDYFLGSATVFPPGRAVSPGRALSLVPGKIDIAIDVEITFK